jgi:2OG-Fe(II) oxygenase superfamily
MVHDDVGKSIKQEEGISQILVLEIAKSDYAAHGFCILSFHDLAGNRSSWIQLHDLTTQDKCHFEMIHKGDTDEDARVSVARFLVDTPVPTKTHLACTEQIVAILTDNILQKNLQYITDQKRLYIRRCQSHIILPDGFIGKHLDVESNPDYLISLVIAMNNEFKGGTLRIESYSSVETITLRKGEAIIFASELPHEVETVHEGYRNSFACFFSSTLRPNPTYLNRLDSEYL